MKSNPVKSLPKSHVHDCGLTVIAPALLSPQMLAKRDGGPLHKSYATTSTGCTTYADQIFTEAFRLYSEFTDILRHKQPSYFTL